MLTKNETKNIIDLLGKTYEEDKTMLRHENDFELMIATILSAQCTDVRVNKVTPDLFKAYPTPEELASANQEDVEDLIRTCGLYRTKAKNIIASSKMLIEDFNSIVPNNLKDLLKFPGVGRKTANVVLFNAFNIPAIAVDTHVFRVSNRIGIVEESTVEKTEIALMQQIEKEAWGRAHHYLILLGRDTCKARSPQCERCVVKGHCKYYKNNFLGKGN